MPVASVIMLDEHTESGRIQLDFKPYKAPRDSSFGLELSGLGNPLYETCRVAWSGLLDRSIPFDPAVHLGGHPET
jgi:hypothetical protein